MRDWEMICKISGGLLCFFSSIYQKPQEGFKYLQSFSIIVNE